MEVLLYISMIVVINTFAKNVNIGYIVASIKLAACNRT